MKEPANKEQKAEFYDKSLGYSENNDPEAKPKLIG